MKKIVTSLLFVFISFSLLAQIPAAGLIGYWPFNGNANDSTGNGYNGIVTGALPTTDRFGNPNAAYSFGDTTKFITIADAAPLRLSNTDFTISFWINQSNNISNQEAIITKRGNGTQNGYILNVTGTASPTPGHINYQVSGGIDPRVQSDSTVSLGMWYHVAIVYNLSTQRLRIFVNGIVNADSTGIPTPNSLTADNIIIGKDGATGVYPFHGKIDDIAMYNRALSISEIYGIYTTCNSVDITNDIVAQYNFTGDAADISGNNHDGTVAGATLTTDRFGNSNNAYLFNGSTSTITVPDHAALRLSNTDFTISTWINQTNAITTNATILSKRSGSGQNGYVLSLSGTSGVPPNRITFNVSGGNDPKAVSDSIVTSGTWHHVAVVYELSSKIMLIYINGLLNNVKTNMPSPNAATMVNMSIGSDGGIYAFNGKLDDIRLYSRSLSPCDIDSLHNMPDPLLIGLTDLSFANSVEIFPNPAKDIITISNTQFADVTISNAFGQMVKSTDIAPGNNTINISDLSSGLYFVTIRDEKNNEVVKKIIKY